MGSEAIKDIQFQEQQNKTLVVESQHNLLKQENEKGSNSTENTGVNNVPLHPNDLHMIENHYKTELATIHDAHNAADFLKPFFVARDMGFLDALLYKKPFTVTDAEGNDRSLVFHKQLPHAELQSLVQSINGIQEWKSQFVEKVQQYVQGTLAIDELPKKKSESVKSMQKKVEKSAAQKVKNESGSEQKENKDVQLQYGEYESTHLNSVSNFISNYPQIVTVVDLGSDDVTYRIKDDALIKSNIDRFKRAVNKMDAAQKTFFINSIKNDISGLEKMKFENGIQGRKIVKQKKDFLLSILNSTSGLEVSVNNKIDTLEYFVGREKQIVKDLSTELKKQNFILPDNIVNYLGSGLTERWAEQVMRQFDFLQSQSSEGLPRSKLVDMMNTSPFDTVAMQKHGMNHNLNDIVKEIGTNNEKIKNFTKPEQFYQLFADYYKTIKKTENTTDQKNIDKNKQSFDSLLSEIEENKSLSNQRRFGESLRGFRNAFESARSETQTEAFMRSAMPAFESFGKSIATLGDGINQLFDGLKKSGVWDEIAKIVDLLFGTGKREEKLKRYNEIKEADLTLNQSWAIEHGFTLRKTNHDKHAQQPLDKYGMTLKKELPGALFTNNTWETTLDDTKDNKEYQAFMKDFKEQTKWTSYKNPSLQDMIVRAHGTPAQKKAVAGEATESTTESNTNENTDTKKIENKSTPEDIQRIIGSKVDTIYKRAYDEKRDQSKNPQESFSRAVIASLITPPKDSLRVARGVMKADKQAADTMKELEKNKDTIAFRDSLTVEKQPDGKVKITPESGRKIQIDGEDVSYDKTMGITIDQGKTFSIMSTDETYKTTYGENAIKVDNIALLTPKINDPKDGKTTLEGLEKDKEYTAILFDKDNTQIGKEQKLGSGQARELTIENGKKPAYLLLKDDDNGVKQRISFPKKSETEVKKDEVEKSK